MAVELNKCAELDLQEKEAERGLQPQLNHIGTTPHVFRNMMCCLCHGPRKNPPAGLGRADFQGHASANCCMHS